MVRKTGLKNGHKSNSLVQKSFEYLGYLGIVLGVIGIILLLLKIIGVL
ncbi:hypothetical protein HYU21_01380 [Candidatus Woesearchaeota archaeon]|nr:hypothetical protein [Candidatus Woesearchaeota archaeon]